MTAPDRVGARCSRIGRRRHHKYASLFNRLKRCSSPRHGAVGGWHFCEMPKGVLFTRWIFCEDHAASTGLHVPQNTNFCLLLPQTAAFLCPKTLKRGGIVRHILFSMFAALVLLTSQLPTPPAQAAETPRAEAWRLLTASIDDVATLDLLGVLLGDGVTEDVPPAMLAHLMYLSGRFDIAAFYFSVDADLNPDNVESLSNLSGILVELNAADPVKFPDVFLSWAEETARRAVQLRPEDTGLQSNLSFVLRALAERRPENSKPQNDKLLGEALQLARHAADFDPGKVENWTNLARVQYLRDKQNQVDAALENARRAEPDSPAYTLTARALGRVPVPVSETPVTGGISKPRQCSVDFKCSEICPKSIIGQVNLVTCMMENDTQLNNCKAGKPYATAYNCEEEFPVFGAVPGLSNVASVCAPGICFHFRLKGNGDVDIRLEAGPNFGPIKAFVGGDIRYSNKNGFSVTRLNNGVKISLYNRSPAGNLAGKVAEINPAEIKISTLDGKPLTLDGSVMGKGLIKFQ
jgi:tetratricopeptide (TPR) repeat protein